MPEGRFVSYLRVSTQQQGASGLGLEAQRSAVKAYLASGELLDEFVEVETGKGVNALKRRPQLRAALDACRRQKATLVIARIDRLARNVAFISSLMESKVEFVAADMPSASRFTVHIMAAVAEEEARAIGARTKAALVAAKARGVVLGKNGAILAAVNRSAALEHAKTVCEAFADMDGMTYREMVAALNARGVPTANGGRWHLRTVQRVKARLSEGNSDAKRRAVSMI